MKTQTQYGKILSAEFGLGGYQDCMVGLSLTIGSDGWAVGVFDGTWQPRQSDQASADFDMSYAKIVRDVHAYLQQAKVAHVSQLVGVPVVAEFGEDQRLITWRILSEVR